MMSMAAIAQTTKNQTVSKFTKFYKSNQADSLFGLFSSELQTALKIEGTQKLISQLKAQLGEIVKVKEEGITEGKYLQYRLSFERPLVDMMLTLTGDTISGIHQKAVEVDKNDPTELESPDNYSVNNANGSLAGTLTLPKNTGKVPVVLMIAGSGPTDRNMNQGQALKSNSFLMLADSLAQNGIASVRYDKRGVGKSITAISSSLAKLDDFIDDADLFIAKLKADARFSKVIVLGHSEGAAIGLISSIRQSPAALISLCGYESNMADIVKKQIKPIASPAEFKIVTEILDSLNSGKIIKRAVPKNLEIILNPSALSFIMSTIKYNSSLEIAKIKIPVLVIGGTTDLQVGIDEAKHLAAANSKKCTLKIIPEMNHVLKHVGSDREKNFQTYNNPEIPIHEDLTKSIAQFIKMVK